MQLALSSDWRGGDTCEKGHALRLDGTRSRGLWEAPELWEDTGLWAGMRGLQAAPGWAGVQDVTRAVQGDSGSPLTDSPSVRVGVTGPQGLTEHLGVSRGQTAA